MSLPIEVIERDKELRKAANELMELRWHWVKNPDNPDRVGVREYARQVGLNGPMAVSRDVAGWEMYLESQKETSGVDGAIYTGTPTDFRELANFSAEKREIVSGLAEATGQSVTTTARHDRELVRDVQDRKELLMQLGKPEEEALKEAIATVAEEKESFKQHQKNRETEKENRPEYVAYLEMKKSFGTIHMHLDSIIETQRTNPLTTDALLTDHVNSIRKIKSKVEMMLSAVTGESGVDWDAELKSINN